MAAAVPLDAPLEIEGGSSLRFHLTLAGVVTLVEIPVRKGGVLVPARNRRVLVMIEKEGIVSPCLEVVSSGFVVQLQDEPLGFALLGGFHLKVDVYACEDVKVLQDGKETVVGPGELFRVSGNVDVFGVAVSVSSDILVLHGQVVKV